MVVTSVVGDVSHHYSQLDQTRIMSLVKRSKGTFIETFAMDGSLILIVEYLYSIAFGHDQSSGNLLHAHASLLFRDWCVSDLALAYIAA